MQTLFIIAVLVLLLELLYFRIADKYNIIDKPNSRSSHTKVTLRGGGVIFLLGSWLYTVFYGFSYPWFLIGLTAIAGVSFLDDIRPVPNKIRLVVHFLSIFLLFQQFGILNPESWWIILLAVYGVDSILTIVHRILLHENIGEAHRKHAYQLMANELKIPHVVVSSIYMLLQLLVSFGLLFSPINAWSYSVVVLVILVVVYILFKKKYYPLHEAYLKAKTP